MELILTLTLFVTALLVWKVMAMNEHHEHLREDIKNINWQLEGVAKLLAELQPKGPIEIPTRLDPELVEELLATETSEVNGLKVTTPKRNTTAEDDIIRQNIETMNAAQERVLLEVTTPKRNDDKFKEYYKHQAYTTYDAKVKPRPVSEEDRRAKLTENEKKTLETLYGNQELFPKLNKAAKQFIDGLNKPKTLEDVAAELNNVKTMEDRQRVMKEFEARLEFKRKQRELLIAMMEMDERDGLYEYTQTEGHTLKELTEKQKNEIRENVRERKKRSLNK